MRAQESGTILMSVTVRWSVLAVSGQPQSLRGLCFYPFSPSHQPQPHTVSLQQLLPTTQPLLLPQPSQSCPRAPCPPVHAHPNPSSL